MFPTGRAIDLDLRCLVVQSHSSQIPCSSRSRNSARSVRSKTCFENCFPTCKKVPDSVTRDALVFKLPPSNDLPRSFVRSTTTKAPFNEDGYVNRISPALLVDVVSILISLTKVVVK